MTTGMVDAGEEPVRGEKRALLASLVVKLGNVLVLAKPLFQKKRRSFTKALRGTNT
jgi:hypothetical protein